jgi:hypothetical protein
MSDATFQTFLVGGLLVLIGAVTFLAWSVWRWVDRAKDMEQQAISGIGYEFMFNTKRMISELAALQYGNAAFLPVSHPQLEALLTRPNGMDRRAVTHIRGLYDDLNASKMAVRAKLAQNQEVEAVYRAACRTVVTAIARLYLWEQHKGRPPEEAHKTRSWHVRDWMKTNDFAADLLPGLHLRDAVVEELRGSGMVLTPKPLDHTASEYYAKLYNRKTDPRAPMWRRKTAKLTEPHPIAGAAEAKTASNKLS